MDQITKRAIPALTETGLHQMNTWWCAANNLNAGQIYSSANPLLRDNLTISHMKPRLLAIGARRRDCTSSTCT